MTVKKLALPENESRFAHLAGMSSEQIAGMQQAANAKTSARSWDKAMRNHAPEAQSPSERTWSGQVVVSKQRF